MTTVAEVFTRARHLAGVERSGYLDEACAGDGALRAEVEALLAELDRRRVDTPGVARKVWEAAAHCIPARAPATEPVPERVGHHRILRQLGMGGMGVVHEALDEKLGRRVALKSLPRNLHDDPAARARLEREARADRKSTRLNSSHRL